MRGRDRDAPHGKRAEPLDAAAQELLLRGAEQVLGPDHPSASARRATFLFAAGTRLLVVEAESVQALWTLERLLLQNGQAVSETCRALCVFRDCVEAGMRDDALEEIRYIDFMTDIVDPGWLLRDSVTLACFSKSVTPEEREHALARTRAALDASPSSEEPTD